MTAATMPIAGTEPAKPQFAPSAPASPGSILRREFERLSPIDRLRAVRQGWLVVDDPAPKAAPRITQMAFDAMPQAGQAAYRARGGVVGDEPEPRGAGTGAA